METEWLGELETRVREAVARLAELREENGTLRRKVKDLETRMTTLSIPAAEPATVPAQNGEELQTLRTHVRGLEQDLAAAATERDEVRRRMEGLVERLEELAGS